MPNLLLWALSLGSQCFLSDAWTSSCHLKGSTNCSIASWLPCLAESCECRAYSSGWPLSVSSELVPLIQLHCSSLSRIPNTWSCLLLPQASSLETQFLLRDSWLWLPLLWVFDSSQRWFYHISAIHSDTSPYAHTPHPEVATIVQVLCLIELSTMNILWLTWSDSTRRYAVPR